MNTEVNHDSKEETLRIVNPKLYNHVITVLGEKHNIHPYDIEASVTRKEAGFELIIRYGDGYAHSNSELFSHKEIEDIDDSITAFIETVGEACQEVMIADYFKMMKM